ADARELAAVQPLRLRVEPEFPLELRPPGRLRAARARASRTTAAAAPGRPLVCVRTVVALVLPAAVHAHESQHGEAEHDHEKEDHEHHRMPPTCFRLSPGWRRA